MLPPAKTTAPGPFASVATPSQAPNKMTCRKSVAMTALGGSTERSAPCSRNIPAAQVIAIARLAAKSMSGVAARANASEPIVVAKISKHNPCGFFAVVLQSQPGNRKRRAERRNRRRQSRRHFCRGEYPEADRRSPVIERGFFEPRLAVKPRRDPIARLRHLSRDPRVTRLVGPDKPD